MTAPKLLTGVTASKRIMWAIILSLPLILVRLLFSLLVVFHHSYDFNAVTGSVVIWALMAVMEEIIVVLIYLFVGWTSDAAPLVAQGPAANQQWKGNSSHGGGGMGGRMRRGPIHGLVGMAVAKAQGNKHDVEKGPPNGTTPHDPAPNYPADASTTNYPINGASNYSTNAPEPEYFPNAHTTKDSAPNYSTNAPATNNARMSTPTMNTTRRGGSRFLRQGPIHALVGMAVDAASGNKNDAKA